MLVAIKDLVRQEHKRLEELVAQRRKQEQEETERQRNELVEQLDSKIRDLLGVDLYEGLGPWTCVGLEQSYMAAKFEYEGEEWSFRVVRPGRIGFQINEEWMYEVVIKSPSRKIDPVLIKSHHRDLPVRVYHDTKSEYSLRDLLLWALGEYESITTEHLDLFNENQRQVEEHTKRWEERNQQKQALEHEIKERVEREQPHLLAHLEAMINEVKKQHWSWPNGKTLVLYRWRWCTGAVSSEYEEDLLDYDHGLSLSHELDSEGWVTFVGNDKTIKLDRETHKPTVERYVISSIEDLEDLDVVWSFNLKEIFVEVPGLKRVNEVDDVRLDGWRLIQDEDAVLTYKLGTEPPQWIKDLLA